MFYSAAVIGKRKITIPGEIRRQLVLKQKINNIQAAFGLIKAKRGASLEDMENGIRKGASGY